MIENYLANIKVDVIMASYTCCWREWKELDYIPSYNKFYFICGGEGWLKIGNEEYYPVPGQLCLMPAGVLQSYSAISDQPFVKYWCHFTAKVGDRNLFDLIQTPLIIDVQDLRSMQRLFTELTEHHKVYTLSSMLKVQSAILGIIAAFIGQFGAGIRIIQNRKEDKLAEILKFIQENMAADLSIEKLSAVAHFHPNHFIRFFRKNTGMTPMHYLRKVRLEKARNLILDMEMSMAEIAEAVGYRESSHFSRDFKSYTGYSPSDFKKALHHFCKV